MSDTEYESVDEVNTAIHQNAISQAPAVQDSI
jgi:hypothetical protein